MIDGIHRQTSHRRAHAAPTHDARLAVLTQIVLIVAQLTESSPTIDVYLAHLARLEPQVRVHSLSRGVLRRGARAARELTATPRLELAVVHHRADRNVPQRHRRARLDRRLAPGADLIARRDALRSQDIAPLAVGVQDQRDVRGTVRVVLESLDDRRDTVLVAAEVDQAILLPRAAADVSRRDAPEVVARAGPVLRDRQGRVRLALVQVLTAHAHLKARTGRGGLELDQRHGSPLGLPRLSSAALVVDALPLGQAHVGLLPVLSVTDATRKTPGLTADIDHLHTARP